MSRCLCSDQSLLALAFEFCPLDLGLHGSNSRLGSAYRCGCLRYTGLRVLNFGVLDGLRSLVVSQFRLCTRQGCFRLLQLRAIVVIIELDQELTLRHGLIVINVHAAHGA